MTRKKLPQTRVHQHDEGNVHPESDASPDHAKGPLLRLVSLGLGVIVVLHDAKRLHLLARLGVLVPRQLAHLEVLLKEVHETREDHEAVEEKASDAGGSRHLKARDD